MLHPTTGLWFAVMIGAALAVSGVTNSSGAGASAGMGGLVLVTSHGFSGSYMATRFGRSVSAIAGEGTKMERDYDYDSRLFFADLRDADEIGRLAGERKSPPDQRKAPSEPPSLGY